MYLLTNGNRLPGFDTLPVRFSLMKTGPGSLFPENDPDSKNMLHSFTPCVIVFSQGFSQPIRTRKLAFVISGFHGDLNLIVFYFLMQRFVPDNCQPHTR